MIDVLRTLVAVVLVALVVPGFAGSTQYAIYRIEHVTDGDAVVLRNGQRVRLAVEPATDRVDDFGRLLRYVTRVKDGVNVNVALIAVGAAAPYFYEGWRGMYASKARDPRQECTSEGARLVGRVSRHAIRPVSRD